ncbi:MAG: DUF2971 domain-containing protein [Clostridiales bacterium]|nr:DUF2971 domain-containing protein [Clostridiales bacterium]
MKTILKDCLTDEDILYHYCSMDAFIKIIESKKLRLGNVIQMNDPTELSLRSINWIELIYNHYKKAPFKFKFLYDNKEFNMAQYLNLMNYHQDTIRTDSFFVFCMSTLSDDLNQWRVYGDNGNGVCLGFDVANIFDLIEHDSNFTYNELEYEDLQSIADFATDSMLCKIEDYYRAGDNNGLHKFIENFYSDLEFFVLRYKHPAYKAESEARLIYKKHNIQKDTAIFQKTDDIIICTDFSDIKTYKEISLSDMKIKNITFGPTNRVPIDNILLFLHANNIEIDSNQIYYSNIPYRTK